jgi:hypothetical protein
MVVVGFRFTCTRFLLIRVLGEVLRDDNGASPHQLVNKVVLIRTYQLLGFSSFFWVFIWEILLPIPMESTPRMSGVVLFWLFWTVFVLYLLLLFYLLCDSCFFIHLVFRTHVSSFGILGCDNLNVIWYLINDHQIIW